MSGDVTFGAALREELPAIIAMFADDELGKAREDTSLPLSAVYTDAFDELDARDDVTLLVARRDGEVIGFAQLFFLRHLSQKGIRRGQIESVRVRSDMRGHGIGHAMMEEALHLFKERGCAMVQLTTDRKRDRTVRFYERLGFEVTHNGMKLRF